MSAQDDDAALAPPSGVRDRLHGRKRETAEFPPDTETANRATVSKHGLVVVTSIQSLLQPVPSRDTVAGHSRRP